HASRSAASCITPRHLSTSHFLRSAATIHLLEAATPFPCGGGGESPPVRGRLPDRPVATPEGLSPAGRTRRALQECTGSAIVPPPKEPPENPPAASAHPGGHRSQGATPPLPVDPQE